MNDSLDIEQPDQLLAYLREAQRVGPDETPGFETLAGGVSNRTVRVTRASGEAWVMKQALAKLRVAVDWFSAPERIQREAEGLRHLHALAPTGTIPALIFEDPDPHLLAMEAVAEPHANWKTLLLAGKVQRAHVEQFGQLLGTIHRASSGRAELAHNLADVFADRSFFETLRVEPYYRYTAEQHPQSRAFFEHLIADTLSQRLAVVHGDYSPKNILVHRERLILLDYEVIHYGDPAFDLGFSLTHLLSKARHVVPQRAAFLAAATLYWETYRAALGDVDWRAALEPRAVRHTLACLLARVDGRSPLEYLSAAERNQQRQTVLRLIAGPPPTIRELIASMHDG